MEIIIPENWSEVTLEQYMRFYKSVKPYEKTDDYQKKALENSIYYFCGVSADVYKVLPEKVFTDISNDMIELINKSKTQELVLTFELMNQKYGFIPSLDELQYGEYSDLVTYTKDTWENIALIMSILYRPIVEEKQDKYTIQSYSGTVDSRVELFNKKLTMDVCFGALSFFFNLQLDLLTDILNSSIKNLEKEKLDPKIMKLLATFKESGDFTPQLQF